MRISEKQKIKAKTFFANKEIVTEDTLSTHAVYDEEGRLFKVTKKSMEPCVDELCYMPEFTDTYKYSSIDDNCDMIEIAIDRKSAAFSTKITNVKETVWDDDKLEVINREYLDIGDNGVTFMVDNVVVLDDERLEWIINIPEFYKHYTTFGEFYLSRELIMGEDDHCKSISCYPVNGSLSINEILLYHSDNSHYYDNTNSLIYIDNLNHIMVCFKCGCELDITNSIKPDNITIIYGDTFMYRGCKYEIDRVDLCDKIRKFACQPRIF